MVPTTGEKNVQVGTCAEEITACTIFGKLIGLEANYPLSSWKKMTGKFLNSSLIILAEIFTEIVVEKITHPKNVSQTRWLIHICHVSTLFGC